MEHSVNESVVRVGPGRSPSASGASPERAAPQGDTAAQQPAAAQAGGAGGPGLAGAADGGGGYIGGGAAAAQAGDGFDGRCGRPLEARMSSNCHPTGGCLASQQSMHRARPCFGLV